MSKHWQETARIISEHLGSWPGSDATVTMHDHGQPMWLGIYVADLKALVAATLAMNDAAPPKAEPESTTAVTTDDLHQAMVDVGRRVFRLEDVVTLLRQAAGNNAEVCAAARILDYAVKDLIAANTKMRRYARGEVAGINDCDPF